MTCCVSVFRSRAAHIRSMATFTVPPRVCPFRSSSEPEIPISTSESADGRGVKRGLRLEHPGNCLRIDLADVNLGTVREKRPREASPIPSGAIEPVPPIRPAIEWRSARSRPARCRNRTVSGASQSRSPPRSGRPNASKLAIGERQTAARRVDLPSIGNTQIVPVARSRAVSAFGGAPRGSPS